MITSLGLAPFSVSFPEMGINDLQVNREAFSVGGFSIYWYGICIVLAFIVCVLLALRHAPRYQLDPDKVIDYPLFAIPSAIIGARLYYVLSNWSYYSSDLKLIFDTRHGGLAVLGGVLLAILAVYLVAKKKKESVSMIFDYLIVYIPLGQAIGRWGNFFNQETFGTNTNLPWGMMSDETARYITAFLPGMNPAVPVHPAFLYESIADLLIFFILLSIRKRSKAPYTTMSAYFILYGAIRFAIEGIRTDSLYIGTTQLRTSQVLSAVLLVTGLVVMAVVHYMGLKRIGYSPERQGNLTDEEKEVLAKYSVLLHDEEDEDLDNQPDNTDSFQEAMDFKEKLQDEDDLLEE